MRFSELLRSGILLSAGAASALAIVTLGAATNEGDERLVWIAAGWWTAASLLGAFLGRRTGANPAIARLLADSKAATMMPEHRPGAVIVNRLWPLLVATIAAGAFALVSAAIPAIGAGFPIIWALSWRHQHQAVIAIEERDGVTFYVERTGPLQPVRLVRIPGFRRERLTAPG
jgi:hypothetical protein